MNWRSVAVVACTASLALSCEARAAGDSLETIAEQQRAFDHLLKATDVDSAHIGAIGNLATPALAFRILLDAKDAETRFGDLVVFGRIGGRLIGLCGLKLKASKRYAPSLELLRKQPGEIGGMQGCLLGLTRPVAAVVRDIESGQLCDDYAGTKESESMRATYRRAGFPR